MLSSVGGSAYKFHTQHDSKAGIEAHKGGFVHGPTPRGLGWQIGWDLVKRDTLKAAK